MTDIEAKEFGGRLERAVKDSGKTQANFAREIGVSPSSLNQIIKGKRQPPLDVLIESVKCLGVSFESLLGLPERNRKIDNLGDAVTMLIQVAENVSEHTWTCRSGLSYNEYGDADFFREIVLNVTGSEIGDFFDKRGKMLKNLEDGVISVDLYSMWQSDEIKKLQRIEILDDDNIPW